MKVIREINLCDFEFWAGAKNFASKLTEEELDTLQYMMEDFGPEEGWTETAINDLLWFEQEQICEWLELNWEEVMEREWE